MAVNRDVENVAVKYSAPTYSLSVGKAVENTVKAVGDLVENAVCPLIDKAGSTITNMASVAATGSAAPASIVGSMCGFPPQSQQPTALKYPEGSIGFLDPSIGQFKIAVPPMTGKLFVLQATETTLPSGVVQVTKSQFNRLTKPWYSQTSVKIGGGVLGTVLIGTGAFLAIG